MPVNFIYIGVDPGLDGAVAFLGQDLLVVEEMPTLKVAGTKGERREYDISAMAIMISLKYRSLGVAAHAALESVHSFPGQGVRSMFSMGQGLGIWKGIFAALGIPCDMVTPQRWKKLLMDGMGKKKDASRLRASQLFPDVGFPRKKDHGRAEALLIAEYLRRSLNHAT